MSKRIFRTAAVCFAICGSGIAHASNGPAPTLTIVEPTAAAGTIFLAGFPSTIPIRFTVLMNDGAELRSLVNLNVTVNGVSLYGTADGVNAFSNTNACTGIANALPNICTPADTWNATLSVPWQVAAIGNYTIVVSGKYRGATGTDEEVVTVAQLVAEYPAPPAVANAYINSGQAVSMSGKQRGCVISKIAEQHGQYSAYGPKGGPYDEAAIRAAVNAFASTCPLK